MQVWRERVFESAQPLFAVASDWKGGGGNLLVMIFQACLHKYVLKHDASDTIVHHGMQLGRRVRTS